MEFWIMKPQKGFFVLFVIVPILSFSTGLWARSHIIPMSIDYKMMDAIVRKHYYPDPGGSAIILDQDDGCLKIELTKPRFTSENSQLSFETRVLVRAGKTIFGKCISPISWEGYLVLYESPQINPENWSLSFQTNNSTLLSLNREPALITGLVWDLIKEHVHTYLNRIHIDLSFPAHQVQSFISPMLTQAGSQDSVSIMDSLKPTDIRIDENRLIVNNAIEIPEKYFTETKPVLEKALTESEIEAFISLWEKWDIFLVNIITSLFNQPLHDSEKQVLLDVVLETRYRFVEQIQNREGGNDFVRDQFLSSWQQIHPIFKRHLSDEVERSLVGYLAFFSAADALAALEHLGPVLGIEISEQGFVRLIRLLLDDTTALLNPSDTQNNQLRSVLGFTPGTMNQLPTLRRMAPAAWGVFYGKRFPACFQLPRPMHPLPCRLLILTRLLLPGGCLKEMNLTAIWRGFGSSCRKAHGVCLKIQSCRKSINHSIRIWSWL
jgi:hypothetical protein